MSTTVTPCLVVSDTPATPRGSDECRMNAMRSRQQSDWFTHEHSASDTKRPAVSKSTLHAPSNGVTDRDLSPNRAAGLSTSEIRSTTTKVKKSNTHQNGDHQDWYKFGENYKDVVIGRAGKSRNARGINTDGTEVKAKLTSVDSNDWFRHEHAPGEELTPRSRSAAGRRFPTTPVARESVNSPLWPTKSNPDATPAQNENETAKSKMRPEEAAYLKRNKAGTTSDWFPHDHPEGEPSGGNPTGHHKGSKESAQNAARSKGESSKLWFTHDPNSRYSDPKPQPRLTTRVAKQLMEQSKGSEMKQVLRMDQNLKTTWTAPSATQTTADNKQIPNMEEHNQTLIDKLLTSQEGNTTVSSDTSGNATQHLTNGNQQ